MERRRAVRYKLCLPLLFKWTDGSRDPIQEAAFTRDISTGGVFISCVKCPPVGATLSLEIMLPPNSEIRSHALRLDATAQVIRIASEREERGFGVTGDLAPQEGEYRHDGSVLAQSLSRQNPTIH
jgi:hypothetical protein